jgi:hypothetical protein
LKAERQSFACQRLSTTLGSRNESQILIKNLGQYQTAELNRHANFFTIKPVKLTAFQQTSTANTSSTTASSSTRSDYPAFGSATNHDPSDEGDDDKVVEGIEERAPQKMLNYVRSSSKFRRMVLGHDEMSELRAAVPRMAFPGESCVQCVTSAGARLHLRSGNLQFSRRRHAILLV